jgi:hypothetical protein
VKLDGSIRFYLMELICKVKCKEKEVPGDLILANAPLNDQIEVKKGRSCFAGPSLFNANYQFNPIYYDEISLSKFTEEFLDSLVVGSYASITKHCREDCFVQEIIKVLEIDRV